MPAVPSTAEALQTLLVTDSRRKLADALGVPKSRVDSWARMVRQVDWAAGPEPELPGPAAPLNGSGPHA
jgi:hypothetical protein